MSKQNWFLPAMKPVYEKGIARTITGQHLARRVGVQLVPQEINAECSGCDAPATGWDSFATPFCCDTCRLAVETPALPHCRCAFQASQRRVIGAAS